MLAGRRSSGAMLVLVAAAAVLAGCGGDGASPGEGAPGGLDVPSGFEEAALPSMPDTREGASVTMYSGPGPASEALAAFREAAESAGWEPVSEGGGQISVMGGRFAGSGFEKGDRMLVVQVTEVAGRVTAAVVETSGEARGGPSAQTAPREAPGVPPESDVEGEDLEDVPRFPGSVRTQYTYLEKGDERGAEIGYLAEAACGEVLDYYESRLPDRGWTVRFRARQEGERQIGAEKEGETLWIVCGSSEEHEGHVDVMVLVGT